MSYEYLCSYCKGFPFTDAEGVTTTRVEHGHIWAAEHCTCECHAEQVVSSLTFQVDVKIVIDVREAFMLYCEDHGITRETVDEDWSNAIATGTSEDFSDWLCEALAENTEADVYGLSFVPRYASSVDIISDSPLDGVGDDDWEKLLALTYPHLPGDPDRTPVDPSTLGMDPLFKIEKGEAL